MKDTAEFLRANTAIARAPLVPEIALHLATEITPIWEATEAWLEREGGNFKFGENLKGENRLIEELTRPNALYLSAAAQLRHNQLSPLFAWFGSIRSYNLSTNLLPRIYHMSDRVENELAYMLGESGETRQATRFEDEPANLMVEQFKSLLRTADIGILDMRLNKESGPTGRATRLSRFELKHKSEIDDAWLSLDQESRGTQTLFRLALPILRSIQRGTLLIVDELELVGQVILEHYEEDLLLLLLNSEEAFYYYYYL